VLSENTPTYLVRVSSALRGYRTYLVRLPSEHHERLPLLPLWSPFWWLVLRAPTPITGGSFYRSPTSGPVFGPLHRYQEPRAPLSMPDARNQRFHHRDTCPSPVMHLTRVVLFRWNLMMIYPYRIGLLLHLPVMVPVTIILLVRRVTRSVLCDAVPERFL